MSETRPVISVRTKLIGLVLGSFLPAVVGAVLAERASERELLDEAALHLEAVGRHFDDLLDEYERHAMLAERYGLDGVHLTDGARSVRKIRKELGADPILGAFCAASRHDGMTAGEAGADYVSFGPVGDSGLGDGTRAEALYAARRPRYLEADHRVDAAASPEEVAERVLEALDG